MVGKSTCGSAETGSCRYATTPHRKIASIRSVVATGRTMKRRDGFMRGRGGYEASASGASLLRPLAVALAAPHTLSCGVGRRPDLRPRVGNLDRGAFAQAVHAVDDHHLARRQTFQHRDALAFARAELHRANGRLVLRVDDVDEHSLRAALDRGRRNEDRVAQGIE